MSQTKLKLIIRCMPGSQREVEARLAEQEDLRLQAAKKLSRLRERRERALFDKALNNLLAREEVVLVRGRYYSKEHQPKT